VKVPVVSNTRAPIWRKKEKRKREKRNYLCPCNNLHKRSRASFYGDSNKYKLISSASEIFFADGLRVGGSFASIACGAIFSELKLSQIAH
jgi:hypothetical protein